MSDLRTCLVDGCDAQHPRRMLMCRSHWNGLPKPLRDDLWRAYREDGVFSDTYMAAREACMAHAEGRDPRVLS